MVDGPLTGCFILGQILNAGTYRAYDTITTEPWERRHGFRKHFEVPVMSKLGRLQDATSKFAEDSMRYINWGDIDSYFLEDVKKDAKALFIDELLPAGKIERGVRNAAKMVE